VSLGEAGPSLPIHRYAVQGRRSHFIRHLWSGLESSSPDLTIDVFPKAHAIFPMALQPRQSHHHHGILERGQEDWQIQVLHCELIR
jgi:hypothetical protein